MVQSTGKSKIQCLQALKDCNNDANQAFEMLLTMPNPDEHKSSIQHDERDSDLIDPIANANNNNAQSNSVLQNIVRERRLKKMQENKNDQHLEGGDREDVMFLL